MCLYVWNRRKHITSLCNSQTASERTKYSGITALFHMTGLHLLIINSNYISLFVNVYIYLSVCVRVCAHALCYIMYSIFCCPQFTVEPASRSQRVVGGKGMKRKRSKKEVVKAPRKKRKGRVVKKY